MARPTSAAGPSPSASRGRRRPASGPRAPRAPRAPRSRATCPWVGRRIRLPVPSPLAPALTGIQLPGAPPITISTAIGGGGGQPFRIACPDGGPLSGVPVTQSTTGQLDGVGATCGYTDGLVMFEDGYTRQPVGSSPTNVRFSRCRSGHVVVGVWGHHSGNLVNRLGAVCESLPSVRDRLWKPTAANVRGLPEPMASRIPDCMMGADCIARYPICAEPGSARCVEGKCFFDAIDDCNALDAYDGMVDHCPNPVSHVRGERCAQWVAQYTATSSVFEGCQRQRHCELQSCVDLASGCAGERRWDEVSGWSACNAPNQCTPFMDTQKLATIKSSASGARVGKQVVYVKTDDGTLSSGEFSNRRTFTMRLVDFLVLLPQCDTPDDVAPPPCCDRKPTAVKGVSWARFKVPAPEAKRALMCELANLFADYDVDFVDVPPASGDYAVLWYIEKDCKANFLCNLCNAAGLSLKDRGNLNANDLALVAADHRSIQEMAIAGAHEIGHALGLEHVFEKGRVMTPTIDEAGPSWEKGHAPLGCCNGCKECKASTTVVDTPADLAAVVPLAQPKPRQRCEIQRILTGVVRAVGKSNVFVEDITDTVYTIDGVLTVDAAVLAGLESRYPGVTHMRVWGTVTPKLVATEYRLLGDRPTSAPGRLFVGELSAAPGTQKRGWIHGWSGVYSAAQVAGPPEEVARMATVNGARVYFFGVGTGEGVGCVGCAEEGQIAILAAREWGVIVLRNPLRLCATCPAGYAPTMDGRCRQELAADPPIAFDQATARNVPLFVTRIPTACTIYNRCRYEVTLAQRSSLEDCYRDDTAVLHAGCYHRIQNVASPYLVGTALWRTSWTAAQVQRGAAEAIDCTSTDPPVTFSGQVAESYLSFGRGEDAAPTYPDRPCVRAIEARRWVIETRDCPGP